MNCDGCGLDDPPTIFSGGLVVHEHLAGAHEFPSGRLVQLVEGEYQYLHNETFGPADNAPPDDL